MGFLQTITKLTAILAITASSLFPIAAGAEGIANLSFSTKSVEVEDSGEWFVKIPFASQHYTSDWYYSQYDFTEINPGLGFGYLWHDVPVPVLGDLEVAISAVSYLDSFSCNAQNLQLRATKLIGSVGVGGSVNYTHKCMTAWRELEAVLFPTFSVTWQMTDNIRWAADALPEIKGVNLVGAVGFSLEFSF